MSNFVHYTLVRASFPFLYIALSVSKSLKKKKNKRSNFGFQSHYIITPNTEKVLKRLGIADNDIKTILLNVLRSSIELCNIFIDD